MSAMAALQDPFHSVWSHSGAFSDGFRVCGLSHLLIRDLATFRSFTCKEGRIGPLIWYTMGHYFLTLASPLSSACTSETTLEKVFFSDMKRLPSLTGQLLLDIDTWLLALFLFTIHPTGFRFQWSLFLCSRGRWSIHCWSHLRDWLALSLLHVGSDWCGNWLRLANRLGVHATLLLIWFLEINGTKENQNTNWS